MITEKSCENKTGDSDNFFRIEQSQEKNVPALDE